MRGLRAKIDCHIHSKYSPDGRGSVADIVRQGREKGLTGVCITDHNSLGAWPEIKATKFEDFLVIQGMEVSTRQGHCLALGVREEVPRGLLLSETIEKAEAAGGIGVPSHPFRRIHGVGEVGLSSALDGLAAIEVFNARDGPRASNRRSSDFAERRQLGGTGGSDSHQVFEVGNAYAGFTQPVSTVDDFLDLVSRGKSWGYGVPTPRRQLVLQNAKNAFLFVRRGFRSI